LISNSEIQCPCLALRLTLLVIDLKTAVDSLFDQTIEKFSRKKQIPTQSRNIQKYKFYSLLC
jgi:hypothetical protein